MLYSNAVNDKAGAFVFAAPCFFI